MIPYIFVLLALGSGVGLYFVSLGLLAVLALFSAPFIGVYGIVYGLKQLRNRFTSPPEPEVDVYIEPPIAEAVAETATLPVEIRESPDEEIERLTLVEVPILVETLPYNSHHDTQFTRIDDKWFFKIKVNSTKAKFSAVGAGASPGEAFSIAKQVIDKQRREWNISRLGNQIYIGQTNADLLLKSVGKNKFDAPTVLIIDDDIDLAKSTESIFRQLGCNTRTVTDPGDVHQLISLGEADFIVLDWILGERVRANQVIERAIRVIDTFSDLRDRFENNQPRIITYSVLGKNEIGLPKNKYFAHLDHWQKPISYNELTARSSELLEATGF